MPARRGQAAKKPPPKRSGKAPGPNKSPGPKKTRARAKAEAKADAAPGFKDLDDLADRLAEEADVRDAVLIGKLTGASREACFDGAHEAIAVLVALMAIVCDRVDMRFTPCNLGDGVRWRAKGCGKDFSYISGHFETFELKLLGVLLLLRENGADGELKAPVWNLLAHYVGLDRLRRCVIWNVIPFTAKNDQGSKVWLRVPHKVRKLVERLRVQVLNALGRPARVCSFGGEVCSRPATTRPSPPFVAYTQGFWFRVEGSGLNPNKPLYDFFSIWRGV